MIRAIGKVNTGGGGSGGTLTVTGIVGHTVTATKDGKTYTRTFNSSGVAVFKGLSTGTWTLTMTGDGQTATRTVDVNADYSVTITYFSATINITYPANSNCVVTNSGGQTVASDTNTGSSTKTWTVTVGATGTYTVTATATDGSGKTNSQSVSITAEAQSENVTLSYELVLYSAGGEHTAITGGWVSKRACTLTKNADNLYVVATEPYSANRGVFATANKIDLSQYSRLYYNAKNGTSQSGYFGIGVWASIPAVGTDPIPSAAAYVQFNANISAESYIDVSSLSGEYYVGGQVTKGDSVTGTGYLYEMKLLS